MSPYTRHLIASRKRRRTEASARSVFATGSLMLLGVLLFTGAIL